MHRLPAGRELGGLLDALTRQVEWGAEDSACLRELEERVGSALTAAESVLAEDPEHARRLLHDIDWAFGGLAGDALLALWKRGGFSGD